MKSCNLTLGYNGVIIGIVLVIVVVGLFIVIGPMITRKFSENFEDNPFGKVPQCKKLSNEYKNCYTFLQTVYNGGLQQTPEVKYCMDICYGQQINTAI